MKKYLYSIAFAIMPILNMIMKIIVGQTNELKHYIALFIPILIFILLSYFTISRFEKYNYAIKYIPISVIILTLIDQLIKLILYKFLGNGEIYIPGSMYVIRIVKNEQINALFNIIGVSLPAWITTFARIFTLVFVWFFLKYCKRKYGRDIYLTLAEIFTFAMIVSALIDSTIWGYTLDFIVFRGLQAIDIKDIYAQIGVGSLFVYLIKNEYYLKDKKIITR